MLSNAAPFVLLATASGHGALTWPTPRTHHLMKYGGYCDLPMGIPGTGIHTPSLGGKEPVEVTCSWYSEGCLIGCGECNTHCGVVGAALKRCCNTTLEPTLDSSLRTYQDLAGRWDIGMKYNPWRAPGFAPVMDPCGVVSGGQNHAPYYHPTIPNDMKGTELPELDPADVPKQQWIRGSEQDVAWNMIANHGGGYAYRLCPKSGKLTEACFQKHHLKFVGNTSWIQWGEDMSNRTAFEASRTSLGTFPADSQWTRNPIAPCWGDVGGASTPFQFPEINQCKRTQFPAILQDVVPARPPYFPLPGLYGYGVGSIGRAIAWDYFTDRFKFHIVDKVHVPEELPAGEYVLSWRWDVEQSPQVWANCADITIVDPEGEVIV
jgi:hypothetical protein